MSPSHNSSDGSSYSSINFETPSSTSSNLPTPTPTHEPARPSSYQTGYTPEKKKDRRFLFFGSPQTKQKIDDLHHYQRESITLQRVMYYEQKMNSRRLSFHEQIGWKFCGSSSSSAYQPTPLSTRNPWDRSPQPPPVSPNSWERGNCWSPLQPYVEKTKDEPTNSKSPSTSSSK